MKRKTIPAFFLALALVFSLSTGALAAGTTTATVPVTLTVSNEYRAVNVTVPAALPVSVVDGYVVTATNAAIRNTAAEGAVHIAAVTVTDGTLAVGHYEHFEEGAANTIALSLNGCPTQGAGELAITEEAFPAIGAGESLALNYDAKVNAVGEPKNETAATVVFTIAAVE